MGLRMGMDNKSGKTDRNTMDNGKVIKLMVKELSSMQMEIYMRVSGSMIKLMDMEHINMPTEPLMLVSGLKISNMEQVLKNGQMVLSTRDNIKTERNTVMDA